MSGEWRQALPDGAVHRPNKGCTDDPCPRVAVIPFENREQVERLRNSFIFATNEGMTTGDAMQHALREFANPSPPKPDEPTDPAARATDKYGSVWARVVEDGGKAVYWVSAGSRTRSWDSLVEDLSPIEVTA